MCGGDGATATTDTGICRQCVANPGAARAALERERKLAIQEQHRVAARAQAAYNALDQNDRARWSRICELRAQRDAGVISDRDRDLLARSLAALASAEDPRYSDAMRRALHADDDLFWSNAELAEIQRKINIRIAVLREACEPRNSKQDAS